MITLRNLHHRLELLMKEDAYLDRPVEIIGKPYEHFTTDFRNIVVGPDKETIIYIDRVAEDIIYQVIVNDDEQHVIHTHFYREEGEANDCKDAYEDGTIPLMIDGEPCPVDDIPHFFSISVLKRQVL